MKYNPLLNRNKIFILLILIPLLYYPCFISNDYLIGITQEDGPYETVGAILFLVTAILFLWLAFHNKSFLRIYFLLFFLLFFFAFGEEISWGQRIFGFGTPEQLKNDNVQGEFNLHNLEFFHGNYWDGTKKEGLASMFTAGRMFYLLFFIYLVVLPLLSKYSSKGSRFIQKLKIPIPDQRLGFLFIFNIVVSNIIELGFSDLKSHGIVEIKEFVTALLLFILPFYWLTKMPQTVFE